jgi:hypothetical protein
MLIDQFNDLKDYARRTEAQTIATPQLRLPVHALLVYEGTVAAEILDAGDTVAQQQPAVHP